MARGNPFVTGRRGGRPRLPSLSPFWFLVAAGAGITLLIILVFTVKSWVYVKSGEIAVFVKKTGQLPASGETVMAPNAEYKGIQHEILSEGWHFRNYFTWERIDEYELNQKTTIPSDACGVRVRLYGEPLPPGEILAQTPYQRGIVSGVLEPGTHVVNRLAYDVLIFDKIDIPSGFVGVVCNRSGDIAADPNVFVVQEGERGIQARVLPPSTQYVNPFERQIVTVDVRSQIYQLSETATATRTNEMVGKPISFPSKDGFLITLAGKIEWKINPERVAEVFVKYADERPVIHCVVEEIILPSARSFTRIYGSMEDAHNFIEGSTRQIFQEKLFVDMQRQCGEQGIDILNVSITEMQPPPRIAALINDREVAKRLKAKYIKEKDREKQEKQLAMEKKLEERSRQTKEIEATMSVKRTKAEQEKRVAIIEADKMLSVVKLDLEASRKQANAVVSRGQAKADVIGYNNIAESAGIRKATEAFKSGESYARYLFLQKVAPGFAYILANTDGPFIKVFEELFQKEAK